MVRDKNIIVGLDVGTTKIAAVIARVPPEGSVNIIGVGTAPSRGLKNGIVVNMDETSTSIKRAIEEAERIAGVRVDSVITGISGDHIKTIDSSGMVAVSGENNEITKQDVERVLETATSVSFHGGGVELLHVIPREYVIDGQGGIKNPVGMFGRKLEVKVSLITGDINSVNNIVKCVERAGYRVQDLVLQCLASSYSVLEPEEKELGVILLDIGGGTTDCALFLNGSLYHTHIVPLGGENVTSDLAKGLRTSREVAEKIKIQYGLASEEFIDNPDILVPIPGIAGREEKNVSIQIITNIISMRVKEILEFAYLEVKKDIPFELVTAGIVLTGGTAKLKGIAKVAEDIFGLQVKVGIPESNLSGLKDVVHDPAFATAVGLIMFGKEHKGETEELSEGKRSFEVILKKMKSWFEDLF